MLRVVRISVCAPFAQSRPFLGCYRDYFITGFQNYNGGLSDRGQIFKDYKAQTNDHI